MFWKCRLRHAGYSVSTSMCQNGNATRTLKGFPRLAAPTTCTQHHWRETPKPSPFPDPISNWLLTPGGQRSVAPAWYPYIPRSLHLWRRMAFSSNAHTDYVAITPFAKGSNKMAWFGQNHNFRVRRRSAHWWNSNGFIALLLMLPLACTLDKLQFPSYIFWQKSWVRLNRS